MIQLNFWDSYHNYTKSDLEEVVIKKAFREFVKGYDCFDDKSSPEMETIFQAFRVGWYGATICLKKGTIEP